MVGHMTESSTLNLDASSRRTISWIDDNDASVPRIVGPDTQLQNFPMDGDPWFDGAFAEYT